MRGFKNGSVHATSDEIAILTPVVEVEKKESWGDRIKREYLGGK